MTPQDFLAQVVRPNVSEFHANVGSLRHAYNAVFTVDALAAHLYWWLNSSNSGSTTTNTDDNSYRNDLAKGDNAYELLRDIAKTQKHVRLTRGKPKVQTAEQVTSRRIGWGEGGYGEGRYGGVEQVVVDISADEFVYVETIVTSALAFLEAEIAKVGGQADTPQPTAPNR
jgi:hypothetical protein